MMGLVLLWFLEHTVCYVIADSARQGTRGQPSPVGEKWMLWPNTGEGAGEAPPSTDAEFYCP